ncbi:hypothetical protein ACL6C3_23495 [Capilliphycus salinus ALCB114379]|uniref:hypothetical protein n=1 Tax=Capilliphycus salinus TaxID=2768948 RepID=UPI0039A447AF
MMKLKLHPAIWVAGAIVLSSLGLRQLWLNTCISSAEFERSLDPDSVPVFIPSTIDDSTPNLTPNLTENQTTQNSLNLTSDPVSLGKEAAFRVSNQTNHPVRVAWRARSPTSEPVHWDFAPQEGRVNGLMLSLPEAELKLQPGDILVVFAQDGSRRYWGPYIVGETNSPAWNSQGEEWLLTVTSE